MSEIEAATLPSAARGAPRFQFVRVFFALMMREMTTRYAKGTGGYLWAVLGPVLAILVMSMVFAQMFRTPSLGTSFILFYTSGYVPFHMYGDVQNAVSGSVKYNRALMQYPAVTPLDAVLARATLSILTVLFVGVVILAGAIAVTSTPVNLDFEVLSLALLTAALLGVGIGSLNCVVIAFFPTWERLWRVATTPLFICSAIIYIYEEAPRAFQEILWYNPLVHVTGYMRSGIFGAYAADYVSLTYVWGLGLTVLLIGLYLARRHRSTLINPRF
ncbi:MAG TPA: ABC transporter permease [Paracoccaceae bacterium]|nr:ABC transporter permease [Paracoccaceae bacterium]